MGQKHLVHNSMGFINDLSPGSQHMPSMREIVTELNAYVADSGTHTMQKSSVVEDSWEEIGIQLEVDYDVMIRIRRHNHVKSDYYYNEHNYRSFRDMISEWLKQKSPSPTWSSLVIALRLSKLPEFADHLESKYCKYTIIMSTLYTLLVCVCVGGGGGDVNFPSPPPCHFPLTLDTYSPNEYD